MRQVHGHWRERLPQPTVARKADAQSHERTLTSGTCTETTVPEHATRARPACPPPGAPTWQHSAVLCMGTRGELCPPVLPARLPFTSTRIPSTSQPALGAPAATHTPTCTLSPPPTPPLSPRHDHLSHLPPPSSHAMGITVSLCSRSPFLTQRAEGACESLT